MAASSRLKYFIRHIADMWRNAASTAVICAESGCSLGLPRLIEGHNYIQIGRDSCLRDGAWLGAYQHGVDQTARPHRIVIHNGVYIGFFSTITAIDLVEIHSGTVISDHFFVSDHMHGFDPRNGSPTSQPLGAKGPVIIGKNCFVGMRVSILSGVSLGEHCVVGAHSVVTRSFPERSMIAGAPAKLIKTFDLKAGEWISRSIRQSVSSPEFGH